MTVEEIFNKIATHMCEGVKYHEEMAKAYDFLGFWGLYMCHIHHSLEEKNGYNCLSHYYATHYFKLLQLEEIEDHKLIPENWYKYTTQAVDNNTKRSTVKDLMTKWVEWERKTKKLYQDMRQELTALGELDAAMCLDSYICDVSKELCHAEKKFIKLETLGYDINYIISWQDALIKKYKNKIGW